MCVCYVLNVQLLDTEDLAEAENKDLAGRLESLESIVRMLELKHKNSLEHANRLEEREGDLKKVIKVLCLCVNVSAINH